MTKRPTILDKQFVPDDEMNGIKIFGIGADDWSKMTEAERNAVRKSNRLQKEEKHRREVKRGS